MNKQPLDGAKAPAAKPVFATNVDEKGLEFIARWEGCVLHPYNDPWNATIGVGHLLHMGKVTKADEAKWKGFTYPRALALLKQDASKFVHEVNGYGLKLHQNEFDALVSAAFNLGSIPDHVVKLLHAGDKNGAMNVLQEYCHANGQEVLGLVRRRAAEVHLYLHNTYAGP